MQHGSSAGDGSDEWAAGALPSNLYRLISLMLTSHKQLRSEGLRYPMLLSSLTGVMRNVDITQASTTAKELPAGQKGEKRISPYSQGITQILIWQAHILFMYVIEVVVLVTYIVNENINFFGDVCTTANQTIRVTSVFLPFNEMPPSACICVYNSKVLHFRSIVIVMPKLYIKKKKIQ
ncbi:hypothetical protein EJB05_14355 [Eragrostis curvula]|uniref:Uncharacterized protein n=1 Tax=Eragrostis curvula TaxID=38414 RepID=A0A5J9W014_9POAL|nr:hypothetical protein EJB05_14355 [Eragrostis curvula]